MVFEFLGFLAERAEARWLLEVTFHGILIYSCYLGYGDWYFGCPKFSTWQI